MYIFLEQDGIVDVHEVIYVTRYGAVCSWESYKKISHVANEVMGDFVRHMKAKKPTSRAEGLEFGKLYLDGEGDNGLRRLGDALVEGFIPPALARFFTRVSPEEEYVILVTNGIRGMYYLLCY